MCRAPIALWVTPTHSHFPPRLALPRYAFSEILQNFLPFTIMLHPTAATSSGFNTHTAALVANTIGVLVWCLIAYLFYRNKFFYNL